MKKSAFTMIELVFVIVVLGIIASIAMSRMERDLKQEASETILSHIRLAQQLALSDNKHRSDSNVGWQKAYWRVDFNLTDSYRYSVASDMDLSASISKEESAIDPSDGKYIYNNLSTNDGSMSEKVLLEKKFGINNITSSVACPINSEQISISFDYLGRPHSNISTYIQADFSNILTDDCNITFTLSTDSDNDGLEDTFTIVIEAETGHSFIAGQDNS